MITKGSFILSFIRETSETAETRPVSLTSLEVLLCWERRKETKNNYFIK